MAEIPTVIIGAGHSGLAMSHELSSRGVDHVVLERGQVGNSWRTERWDGLRLLSPNWMNGLPGLPYAGDAPDGYMDVAELLTAFAASVSVTRAPVRTETRVISVTRENGEYQVQTDQGMIHCASVVIATGPCARPKLPDFATDVSAHVAQFTPLDYKRPSDLPTGGILVVGASASGLQLARELAMTGRQVTLAVGNHLRLPRDYRGVDILKWMDATGVLDIPYDEVDDIERVRRTPSLPLLGSDGRETLDLNALQDLGVEITGRLAALADGVALFSGSLPSVCTAADLKLNRLLDEIDAWVERAGGDPLLPPAERFPATRVPESPRLRLDLAKERIGSIVWATGYLPDHGWLQLPVFDRKGRIVHDGGVVAEGLCVMGLPYLRSRHSTHIAGGAADARALAGSLLPWVSRSAA